MTEDVQRSYALLGLDPGAAPDEIKKAYFRLVRVHPPEKDPEEFQEIRRAYEMLKDGPPVVEEERFSAPEDPNVLYLLEQARRRSERKEYRAAADCVADALTFAPDHPFLLLLLARLQIRAGNPRKAANTAKKLQKCAPDFSEAYALAANGYYASGWYKKAFPEYKKAYELGYRDFDFLTDYADAADDNGACELAAVLRRELLKNTKWDQSNIDSALYLYRSEAEHCKDESAVLAFLEEYGQFLSANRRLLRGQSVELAAPLMFFAVEKPQLLGFPSVYSKIDTLAESLERIVRDMEPDFVENVRIFMLFTSLRMDPDFSDSDWPLLAQVVLNPNEDGRMTRYGLLDTLLCLLKEREQSLAQLEAIRSQYPFFYQHIKEYCGVFYRDKAEEQFEKLKREHARLSEQYAGGQFYKRYPEEKTLPRGVLAYSDSKPFVRETKKPGRNDPCPCGSGLKFKRCCLGKGIYD